MARLYFFTIKQEYVYKERFIFTVLRLKTGIHHMTFAPIYSPEELSLVADIQSQSDHFWQSWRFSENHHPFLSSDFDFIQLEDVNFESILEQILY